MVRSSPPDDHEDTQEMDTNMENSTKRGENSEIADESSVEDKEITNGETADQDETLIDGAQGNQSAMDLDEDENQETSQIDATQLQKLQPHEIVGSNTQFIEKVHNDLNNMESDDSGLDMPDEFLDDETAVTQAQKAFGIPLPPRVPSFKERMHEQQNKKDQFVVSGIVLENFKSYANRVAIGPFHHNFTCIIGPNGSGKSNTIDALLFVFGYKSKEIRASKLSELIHHSEKFPNFTWCRVTVRFARVIADEKDIYSEQIVPNSEYSISREAHKDGSSFYMIDGRKSTQKDVTTRLRKDNIDLDHSRFLILQGEVESIAMMKPKGKTDKDVEMLEFIEDIVGTNQYKEPIAKMSEINEKLAEEEETQKVKVESFHRSLVSMQAVKEETERFLELENEITVRRHQLVQIDRDELVQSRETLLKTREECDAQLKQLDPERALVAEKQKTKALECEELHNYVKDYEKGNSGVEKEYTAAETKKNSLAADIEALAVMIPNLEKEQEKQTKQLENSEHEPEQFRQQIEELTEAKTQLAVEKEKIQADLKQALERVPLEMGDRKEKIKALEVTKNGIKPILQERQKEVDSKELELQGLRQKHTRASQKLAEYEEDLQKRQKTVDDATKDLNELEPKLPDYQQTKNHAQNQLRALKQNEQIVDQQLRAKQDQITEAEAQSRIQTNDRILKALLEAQQRGQVYGILGRMGDLATIDRKYDAAVSTNFGGRLDNIITDTQTNAKNAIEYLKRNNIGRATFMSVDAITRAVGDRSMNAQFTAPRNSERIFDLLRITTSNLRPIFYYVMGNTLVADDLNTAKNIAYGQQKHKVATLDGKLVDGHSGSMTGGGQPWTGKIRSNDQGVQLNRPYEGPPLEQLRTERTALEQNLAQIRADIAQHQEAVSTAEANIASGTRKLGELKKTIQENQLFLETLNGTIARQKQLVAELKPDPAAEKRSQEELQEAKQALEEIQQQYKTIEEKINNINKEIKEIAGKIESPVREREKKVKKQIEDNEKALADVRKKLNTHESKVNRLKTDVEKRATEIETKKSDLIKAQTELVEADERLSVALKKRTESRETFKDKKASLDQMNAELEKLDGELDILDKRIAVVKTNMQKAEAESNKLQRDISATDKELQEFRLQEIKGSEHKLELRMLSSAELQALNIAQVNSEIEQRTFRMKTMKPDPKVLSEYYNIDEKRRTLMDEVEQLRRKRKMAYVYFMHLKNRRFAEFMDALRTIRSILKTTYRQLTMGGDASLEPIDRFDPFSEGLEFMVKPKGKSWKNIHYLSGGEKTISSLSLIFSLHYFKPTPFYIMDEIDAALDYRNTSIIAFFVKERSQSSQFIIVSLRNQMFETAYRLIGICKPDFQSMAMFIDPLNHVMTQEEAAKKSASAMSMFSQATLPRPQSMFSQATEMPAQSQPVEEYDEDTIAEE